MNETAEREVMPNFTDRHRCARTASVDDQRCGAALQELVGESVLIRTVTMYHLGRVVSIEGGFIKLEDASWVADTGRFSTALATGKLNEVERFPGAVYVALGAVVDITPWAHPLPTETR